MALDARGDLLLGPPPLSREEFDAQVVSAMRVVENGKSANTGSTPCFNHECPAVWYLYQCTSSKYHECSQRVETQRAGA